MNNIGKYQHLDVGNGLRVISLFSGAGGLDLGFKLTGYEIVYATDNDKICCETLKSNLKEQKTQIVCEDIRKIDFHTLPKNIDLIIGGPPCQSFSASGRRAGGAPGRLDDRGTLFEAYKNIINYVKPKAFLFENVRGILGTNKGEDWKVILEAFGKIGYKISYRILDALDYGAPQQRERMIMVGHEMAEEFLFPHPAYGPDSLNNISHITAEEALSEIYNDQEDKNSLILRNGKYAHLLPLVPPGENYLFFTAKRGYPDPIFAYRSRFSDFLYKANPASPIKTLIASPGKYTGPFHWDNRCFTVREYMRLQGFPDDYQFVGERTDKIKQIGNSVSPKLSYQLAIALSKQIFNRKISMELMPCDFVLSFDSRKGKKAAKTKAFHINVQANSNFRKNIFKFKNYEATVHPNDIQHSQFNVSVKSKGNLAKILVNSDDTKIAFSKMKIEIYASEQTLGEPLKEPEAILEIITNGSSEFTIQTMWNAIDDWVIKSSNFNSLFELYGHFTEPHPIFKITKFQSLTKAPIAAFASHISKFDNCSKYFPREHLTDLFGLKFETNNFVDLVKLLRNFRFDIRCHETNIAIPKDVYMVTYPFTLPYGKQMNFSIKENLIENTSYLKDQSEVV